MSRSIRILHLDDNPLDAQLVAMALNMEQEKLPTIVRHIQTKDEYLAALSRKDFDLILSDYRMPGYDGDQALKAAQESCPDIPFIMVTGELGEELVIETLKRGATDYVLKDRIFRLVPAIQRALAEAENNRKRKEAEDRLRESEERYRRVVFNIHDALLVDNVEGRVVFANDRFFELFGFQGVDLTTIRLEDYVAPEYQQLLRERHDERMLGHDAPTQFEYRGIRRDGTSLWLEVTVVRLVEHGRIVGTQSTIRNVTERHEAEEARERLMQEMLETERALQESEERYRAALANHHFILSQADKDARYTWVHDPLLGLDSSTLLGKRDSELNDSSQARQFEEVKRRVIETGLGFRGEIEIMRLDGVHYYEMVIEPRRSASQQVIGLTTAGIDITERKRTEQALLESRETLALAVKATNLGLFDYYPRSGIILWNDLAKEHFGLPPDAHIDIEIFMRAIHPEDRESFQVALATAMQPESGGYYYSEYRAIGIQDKKERYIVSRGRVYFDKEGNAVRLIGARSDVTAQKQTEDALRAHEATMDSFFEASPAVLNILDDRMCFVQTDRLTPEYFGLDRKSIVGRSFREFLPDFADKFLRPIMERVITTGRSELNVEITSPIAGQNGGESYWQAAFFPVALPGRKVGLGVMAIDMTKVKTAQLEVQQLQEQYRLLVEQQSDMIAKISREGKILYLNRRCLEMVGLSEAQVLNTRYVPEIESPDMHGIMEEWKKTFEPPQYQSAFELRIRTPRGWRWISLRNKAVMDQDGEPTMAIAVARDVTERKDAEEEVRRREARFRLLISSSKEAIALVDEQGIILAISESAAEFLGCEVPDLVNKDVHELIYGTHQIDDIRRSLARLEEKPETPQYLVLRLHTQNKPNLWVEVEATGIPSGEKIDAYLFRLRPVHMGGGCR